MEIYKKMGNMLFEDRQRKIVKLLEHQGSVRVDPLSKYLGVSKVTVRKHLDILSKEIPMTRVRGGAISTAKGTSYEPVYGQKFTKNLEIKKKIGALAASLVQNGETLMLDSGSTTWHVAFSLLGRGSLTVVTSDINIAFLLADSDSIEVYLTGGKVRPYLFSIIGRSAEKFVKNFNIDKLFLGVDSIDIEKGITNANVEEAYLKKEMIHSANAVIVVTDSSKFNKVSLADVSDFSNIHHVITDENIPEEYKELFKEREIKLSIV